MFIDQVVSTILKITDSADLNVGGELNSYLSPLLRPPDIPLTAIWAACSYKTPEPDPDDGTRWPGDPTDSLWTTQLDAQAAAEEKFLAWARSETESTTIIPGYFLWAPSHNYPESGQLVIWVAYRAAAPSGDDKNRTFYPQMRETSFWVEKIEVSNPAGRQEADFTWQPGGTHELRIMAEGWAEGGNNPELLGPAARSMLANCGREVLAWLDSRQARQDKTA